MFIPWVLGQLYESRTACRTSGRPDVRRRRGLLQNSSFKPNWLIRAGRADVTTPKFAAVRFVDTVANCVWFSALNDSRRNCSRTPLVMREVLEKREIQVVHTGAALGISSEVSERAGRRLCERSRVEPPVHGLLTGIRIAHQVGAVGAERVVEPAEICGRDRERESALPGVDAVDLPAADERVLDARRVAGELLAAAEREVVDEAADEPMVDVEVGQTVVALRVVIVEEALPAVEPARADAGRGRLRVGALRPGIGERQDRADAAMLELGVERVVVRAAAPVAVDVGDEVRKRLARGDRLRDGPGRTGIACAMLRRISRLEPCVPM